MKTIQVIKDYLKNPLYKNSIFLIFNTIVTSGLGFIFWIVVARFYSEADVGLASATTSAMSLIATLGLAGLNTALIRYLNKTEKPFDLLNTCLTLSGVLSLIAGTIFVIGLDIWSPTLLFIKENLIYGSAFVAFGIITSCSFIIDSAFIIGRKSQFVLFKNGITSTVKIFLPIILVLFFRSFGIIASWGISALIALLISIFIFMPITFHRFRLVPKVNLGLFRGIWRYSIGNYLASIASLLPSWILPIVVLNILGPEQNAYFYVALMISGLLSAIPMASSNSLFAEGSHFEDELWINLRKTLRFNYLLLIPSILMLFFLSSLLLSLFGANYSASASSLLKILAISNIFNGINFVYFTVLKIKSKLKEMVLIYSFISLATVIGSYFAAKQIGLMGIGYVQFTVSFFTSIYVLHRLRMCLLSGGNNPKFRTH
jgi:O-antigen/teichoic acid export membrane protein